MVFDLAVRKELGLLVAEIDKHRCSALSHGEGFTDNSSLSIELYPAYDKLVSAMPAPPSVVEYGGGVPVLSLYMLAKKRISGLVVIDNDTAVLFHLKKVKKGLHLPVDIQNFDIEKMVSFPDTDLGVSFNSLYGFSPTPGQKDNPPVLSRRVISEAKHKGFGVFRHLNVGCGVWQEFPEIVREIKDTYQHEDHGTSTKPLAAMICGFQNVGGEVLASSKMESANLHYVLGWDRKSVPTEK